MEWLGFVTSKAIESKAFEGWFKGFNNQNNAKHPHGFIVSNNYRWLMWSFRLVLYSHLAIDLGQT